MLRRVVRFSVALTATAATAAVAACGGQSSNPPQAGPSSSSASASTPTTTKAPPPIVAPAQLQPGKYPTAPQNVPATAGNPGTGAIVDARRLAGYVAGPWAVDPQLSQPFMVAPVLVLDKSDALGQLGPDSIAEAAGRHHFVNGFASTRQSPDKLVLVNAVLQFASPDDANQAATDMNTAGLATSIKGGKPNTVAIQGHPETLAASYQVGAADHQRTSVRAFTPHGSLVLMQLAQGPGSADAIEALVAKTIQTQLPKLDGFTPADAGALAAVPVDPTGLLALTLPSNSTAPTKNAVYSGDGALHFQVDPIASAKTFADDGITEMSMGLTNVARTKDPWAAVDVVDTFAREEGQGGQPADAVPGLPLSKCVSLSDGKQFYCVAPAGEYAIEAHATDLNELHEQVAAQYILLTAPKR